MESLSSRPLLADRENAGLNLACIVFTLNEAPFIHPIVSDYITPLLSLCNHKFMISYIDVKQSLAVYREDVQHIKTFRVFSPGAVS